MENRAPFIVTIFLDLVVLAATALLARDLLLQAVVVVGLGFVLLRANPWALSASLLTALAVNSAAAGQTDEFLIFLGLLIAGSILQIVVVLAPDFQTGLSRARSSTTQNAVFAFLGFAIALWLRYQLCDPLVLPGVDSAAIDTMSRLACQSFWLDPAWQRANFDAQTSIVMRESLKSFVWLNPAIYALVFAAWRQVLPRFSVGRWIGTVLKGFFISSILQFVYLIAVFAVVLLVQGLSLFVFTDQADILARQLDAAIVDNPVLWLTTIPLTVMAIAIFINSMIIGYSVRTFPSD